MAFYMFVIVEITSYYRIVSYISQRKTPYKGFFFD